MSQDQISYTDCLLEQILEELRRIRTQLEQEDTK